VLRGGHAGDDVLHLCGGGHARAWRAHSSGCGAPAAGFSVSVRSRTGASQHTLRVCPLSRSKCATARQTQRRPPCA
jgi:hypothetical protein